MSALAFVRAVHYVAVAQMFGAALFAAFVGRPALTGGARTVGLRRQLSLLRLVSWGFARNSERLTTRVAKII